MMLKLRSLVAVDTGRVPKWWPICRHSKARHV